MLLAFDVGNTNIVLGVFKGKKLIQNWRMETDKDKSADEYGMLINQLFKYHNLNTADVADVIHINGSSVDILHTTASFDKVLQHPRHRSWPGYKDRYGHKV